MTCDNCGRAIGHANNACRHCHAPTGAPPREYPTRSSGPHPPRELGDQLLDFIEPIGLVVVICTVVGAGFGWFDALATAAPSPHEAFYEHGWGRGAAWGAGIGLLLGSAGGIKNVLDRS